MDKKLTYGVEAQEGLQKGIDILAEAVKTTLGARGRNVMIEDLYGGAPHITKDGVTVAKSIEVGEPLEAQGIKLMKQVALNTNNEVGDGTTTSTVLAQAIIKEGLKKVNEGVNPIYLQRGINLAVEEICKALEAQAKEVAGNTEFIKQIASISANNDTALGELIAEAFESVGKYGVIKVEPSQNSKTYTEHIKGMKFESGLYNPMFIDPDKRKMVFENPKILVTDHKLNKVADFGKTNENNLLNKVLKDDETLIIICDELDTMLSQQLILYRKTQNTSIFVIKAPEFGQDRTEVLNDIAILTGASFISKEQGLSLEDVSYEDLGSCDKLETDTESTTIINGAGDKKEIENRVTTIQKLIPHEDLEHKKTKLQERVAKLSGGVAVLHIGAKSEIELKEIMDRVDDAINATKAAIEEGVVAGGGIALTQCKFGFKDTSEIDAEELEGVNIINDILAVPFKCIIENAGENVESIIKVLAEKNITNFGYDVKGREFGDMFELGILDPVKVTRTALQNAASVASTLLTTQCVITNVEQEEQKELNF